MTIPSVSAGRTASLLGVVGGDQPAYRALADGLRLLVADGRIPAGTRLPSERALTGALGVSRTTVTRAYAVLRESGWLTSRAGSGSVATLPAGSAGRGRSGSLRATDVGEGVIDLTCAATRAPSGVQAAYERAVEQLPCHLTRSGYHLLGLPELREAIAGRFAARGVPTTSDQVMVTSGAVTGLAVVVRALLSPGDRVVVESPTYPNSLELLRGNEIRTVAIPVEPHGWDVAEVAATIRGASAGAALLLPDFHNPTGNLMSDGERSAVVEALRRAGTRPIVDETVAEVDLAGEPLPRPFSAYHPGTITVGGASKVYWGGLRIGWLRVPGALMDRLVDARTTVDLGAPVLEQLALLELLRTQPGLSADRREGLVAARDAVAQALRRRLPEAEFGMPRGGLSLWVRLPDLSATEVALAAEAEGLLLASGPRFAVTDGLDHWLRLPYVLPVPELVEAVERLRRAIDRVRADRASRPRRTTTRPRTRPARPLVA